MNDDQVLAIVRAIKGIGAADARTEEESIASAIRSISHGSSSGPTGLEMLSMAVSGDGLKAPLSGAISDGLHDIAEAIREGLGDIAEAVRKSEG